MAFIMRASLSNKTSDIARFSLWFLLPIAVYPNRPMPGLRIKDATTILLGEDYVLNADIDYQLSEKAVEALNNGVALFWTYQFQSQEQRSYLWEQHTGGKKL